MAKKTKQAISPLPLAEMRKMTEVQRFMHYVMDTGSCWLWCGAHQLDRDYGVFYSSTHMRAVRVHRWSFEYFIRKLKPGERVFHTCGNPDCVNPEHLFAGTYADKVKVLAAEGKPIQRITAEDSVAIRKRRAAGESYAAIAKDYGCTRQYIFSICKGHSSL